jgi:ribosomal protein S18 acetylase RimI-like enzyme
MKPNSLYTELFLSAFADDPLFSLVFTDKDANKTRQAQKWYFNSILEYCRQYGGVMATPDNLGAIAWIDGEHFPPQLDESALRSMDNDIAGKIDRFEEHEKTVERYIKKNADNYGYICLLAVDKQVSGKGYARQLLNSAMQQMKQRGIKYCWLTTENSANINFYTKMGFKLLKTCTVNIELQTYFLIQEI